MERLRERVINRLLRKKGNNFGLLVSGKDELVYHHNIHYAYNFLRDVAGFDERNIFILSGNGNDSDYHPVDGSASKSSLEHLLHMLEYVLAEKDNLFAYFTGRGVMSGYPIKHAKQLHHNFRSDLLLNGGMRISDKEMEYHFGKIKSKGLAFFDFSHSGSFARKTGKNSIIGISSCGSAEELTDYSFSRDFFEAYLVKECFNEGNVSVREAFHHALSTNLGFHNQRQAPRMYSDYDHKINWYNRK